MIIALAITISMLPATLQIQEIYVVSVMEITAAVQVVIPETQFFSASQYRTTDFFLMIA
jgi:hypothetical protein